MAFDTSIRSRTSAIRALLIFLVLSVCTRGVWSYPVDKNGPTPQDPRHVLPENNILIKRSNCQKGEHWPERYDCDGEVPGVDEIAEKVREWGMVGTASTVFYTGWPVDISAAMSWATCFFGEGPKELEASKNQWVAWPQAIDPKWLVSESLSIHDRRPASVSAEDNAFYRDLLLKHYSQAIAEASKGTVYLVVGDETTPDNQSWDRSRAWGGEIYSNDSSMALANDVAGWEWPALTRNLKVERILRVDPRKLAAPREIWKASDGLQGQSPRGSTESTPQRPRVSSNL